LEAVSFHPDQRNRGRKRGTCSMYLRHAGRP
jgi:hypothetical protein